MLLPLILLAGLVAGCAAGQDTRTKTPAGAVEHLLGTSPTARRQALAWARENLDAVAPALAAALEGKPGVSAPFDAIRGLGELKDPRISAALIGLLDRPQFLWKPHAVEALADHAFPGAAGVFARNVSSPVSRSRAAACRGIGAIDMRVMESLVSKCLGDEEAAVRLEAARTLWRFGDAAGIPIVVRDLSLDRRFTDADPGSVAREAAAAFVKEIGAAAGLVPAGVATQGDLDNVLASLRLKLNDPAGRLEGPVALHDPDVDGAFRYAVEARSCQEGDVFLRFDQSGNVVVGRDLLRRFAVDPKDVAPILQALQAMDTGGKGRRILGPVSCDFERFGIRDGDAWRTLVMGTGKREPAFDALEAAVASVIEKARGPEKAAAHRRRVAPFAPGGGVESAPARSAESRSGESSR